MSDNQELGLASYIVGEGCIEPESPLGARLTVEMRTMFKTSVVGLCLSAIGCALLSLASTVTLFAPTPALAQFSPFGYQAPRYRPNNYVPRQRAVRRAAPRRTYSGRRSRNRSSYSQTRREPVGDVMMLVSLRRQRIQLYDKQGLVAQAPISSGRSGYRTPTGVFTILQKNKHHYSNLYNNAPMPNMQRITWSGVALHAGALPGYPASHGCIRLPYSFSRWLFDITKMQGRVIVSDDMLEAPSTISHDKLFRGMPDAYAEALFGRSAETSVDAPAGGVTLAAAEKQDGVASDVRNMLGIARAKAAVASNASLEEKERLARLAMLRQEHIEKRVEIDAELAAAQGEFDKAADYADLTLAQLDEAKAKLKEANAELSQRQKYAKTVAQDAKTAHKKLADFDRKYHQTSSAQRADALFKLAELEEALDTRAVSLSDEVNVANTAVSRQKSRIAGLEANIALAQKFLNDARAGLKLSKERLSRAKAADESYKRAEKNRSRPVSVFISAKTQRLYVRQALQPLFDVPVSIRDPKRPIGTHVFSAIESQDGNASFDWNVVAVQSRPGKYVSTDNRKRKRKGKNRRSDEDTASNSNRVETLAARALDRIDIPQDARDRIENLMRPGSSLIVSDHPVSNETGPYTDFVILTR